MLSGSTGLWRRERNVVNDGDGGDRRESQDERGSLFGVVDVPEGMAKPLAEKLGGAGLRLLDGRTIDKMEELAGALEEANREVAAVRERAAARLKRERKEVLLRAQHEGARRGMAAFADAMATREQMRRDARREAVELAFEIAERILGGEIERDSERVVGMVEETLRRHAGETGAVTLAVHPADRQAVERVRGRLSEAAGGSRVQIDVDDSVDRGGCILRADGRRVDARVRVRLAAMRSALLDE